MLDPVFHVRTQANKLPRTITDIATAATNADWSVLQLSQILYSVIYGTLLQDFHLAAAASGLERHMGHHVIKDAGGIKGLTLVKEAVDIVDNVLKKARAAICEASNHMQACVSGQRIPTKVASSIVWPANATSRAV